MTTAPLDHRASRRIGSVLCRRWRLEAILGEGETAVTYAASVRRGGRVAIRLLHPELSADEAIVARFFREGYTAKQVEHAAAVSAIGHGVSEDGAAFLVLPLVEGQTLRERLEQGPLEPRTALLIIEQLLEVLVSAHDRGVFHRNLCPSHLMLTASDELRVLGFGGARLSEVRQGAACAGSFRGWIGFAPPEQVCGRSDPLNASVDTYAAGALLHFMLCGRPVHEAATSTEGMARTISSRPESLGRIAAHLPRGVVEVVDIALRYEREQRWPDARAMQAGLHRAIDAAGLLEGASRGGRRTRSLAPWVVGGGERPLLPIARAWRSAAVAGAIALSGAALSWSSLSGSEPLPPRAATLSRAAQDAVAVAPGTNHRPVLLCGDELVEDPQLCDIRSTAGRPDESRHSGRHPRTPETRPQ